MNLKNKKVIITGATGGIGNSLVKKFTDNGSIVLVTGTKEEKLDVFEKETVTVFNKCDLLDCFPEDSLSKVFVSSEKGLGLDRLVDLVLFKLGVGEETVLLSRRRHVTCLQDCVDCLSSSLSALDGEEGLELVAENLLAAQKCLGKITRPVSSDDLLGEIFSEFCIGK